MLALLVSRFTLLHAHDYDPIHAQTGPSDTEHQLHSDGVA
jgi:hypothetical protein